MKPFLILHSVTGILTGCDYINSHAIFPWVTDHMRFFGHETDSKFRSENVCVCVSFKKKENSPGAIQPLKDSHPVCWGLFLRQISGENSEARSEVTSESGDTEASRA